MLLEIKIRLTTPILGDVHHKDKIRRLKSTSDGRIKINEVQWLDSLCLGAKQLNLNIDPYTTILLEDGFESPTKELYRRTWSKVNVELFESIRKGTIITFQLIVREDLPNCPTIDQLEAIFNIVGKFFGLSQWGCKFGYGRFVVIDIREISYDN